MERGQGNKVPPMQRVIAQTNMLALDASRRQFPRARFWGFLRPVAAGRSVLMMLVPPRCTSILALLETLSTGMLPFGTLPGKSTRSIKIDGAWPPELPEGTKEPACGIKFVVGSGRRLSSWSIPRNSVAGSTPPPHGLQPFFRFFLRATVQNFSSTFRWS
jgi:hypothetical protein